MIKGLLQQITEDLTKDKNSRKCIECQKRIQKKEHVKYVQIKKFEVAYEHSTYEPFKVSPKPVDETIYICSPCWNASAPKHYRFQT